MRTRGALTSQYICRAGVMRDGGRETTGFVESWMAEADCENPERFVNEVYGVDQRSGRVFGIGGR